ncbi:putative ribonuclease H-like domain-containing protein [Tanacetum coccineum]
MTHPPKGIEVSVWVLCERFASEDFQSRREGKEVSKIKQYKMAHYSKKLNGMINEEADTIWNDLQAEEASSSCTSAEICLKKLGHLPGHIKRRSASTKQILETGDVLAFPTPMLSSDHFHLGLAYTEELNVKDNPYDDDDFDDCGLNDAQMAFANARKIIREWNSFKQQLKLYKRNGHHIKNTCADCQDLFEAIEARFGGNDATKKTQKTLLKQTYENFNALSSESLDTIFNRLQKLVSQLSILGENISQEDLNIKFLRSLPVEWNTHVIVEQEVKRSGSSSSNSGSKNMAFVSTPGSTNEDTAYVQVSIASTLVSVVGINDNVASLSDATVYAFLANQPSGSQFDHEDLEQIHDDDLKEMDLKWQFALLSMRAMKFYQRTGKKITINGSDTVGFDKTKVECFNCHKLGHFAMECRNPRSQESRPRSYDQGSRSQDNLRRIVKIEDTSSKAMVAIDGAGFD